jgi:hypothetical protein
MTRKELAQLWKTGNVREVSFCLSLELSGFFPPEAASQDTADSGEGDSSSLGNNA